MEFLRTAIKLRSRVPQLHWILAKRCNLEASSFYRTYYCSIRFLASKSRDDEQQIIDVAKQQKSILEEVLIKEQQKPKTTAQKVVQKAENTFFYAIFAASVAALGLLAYVLFEQFFSYESPQKIFSSALSMIRADERCQELFGSSIAGYGEESARGRRRHVAHQKYEKDGRERIRVVFHLKGTKARGIAQAEMEKDSSWEWRFLLVQTHGPSSETHVLIDNRKSM